MRTPLSDLAVIGDRRTAALIGRLGELLWYCPGRFDEPSLFGGLPDSRAGCWTLEIAGAKPLDRRYLGPSGILQTRLDRPAGTVTLTDWMAAGSAAAHVLCRECSATSTGMCWRVLPRPEFGSQRGLLSGHGDSAMIDGRWQLHASHRETQDEVAGVQLAVVVAVKLLLSQHQANPNAMKALEAELERMRANILGSGSSERRLWAFNEAAEALLDVLRSK